MMLFWKTLKQGQIYQETWVMHPKLAAIFPENRVIKATSFAQKNMPFIAVFAFVWQQFSSKGSIIALTATALTALFALCIPLQGLYWLGKRSQMPLPPATAVTFEQIFKQLADKQVALPRIEQPTYQDLAYLLAKAEQHLGETFWQEL